MHKYATHPHIGLVRIISIISFFCFTTLSVQANENIIDSLLNELELVSEDTQKVELFLDISWEYHTSDPKQTINYAQRAFDLSRLLSYDKGETASLNLLGIGHDIKGNLDKAKGYYEIALSRAKEKGDMVMYRNCLNNVGLIHQRMGNYQKSMETFHEALEMTDEKKDPGLTSAILNNIGIIHSYEERHEKALEYYEYSLQIEKKRNNELGISMALTNIGEEYREMGKKSKALICYKEALAYSEKIGDKVGEAILLSNIGEVHFENGLLDLAEELYPQALKLASEVGDKGNVCNILNNMAKLQLKKGRFQTSIKYAREALLIAQEMGEKKTVTDIFETLADSYIKVRDFEKAYEYQRLFNEAKDSLFSVEKSRQILELSTQYDTKRKETENELLKEQQAKNEAIIQQRTIIGIAIAVILLLVSIITSILFQSNRQKHAYSQQLENEVTNRTSDLEESNEKLRKSNKELERFAYIASHDLKEPLRNIMSFTKLVERSLPSDAKENKNVKEYMSYIVNNTVQMHQLIEDVLEYSRIDNTKPESEQVDVREIVNSVASVLSSTLKERNVKLNIGALPKVSANSSQLFLVLKNLIENGIKYNESDHPVISVYSVRNGNMHEISVVDNGIGIEEQYFKRIFGMFKRLHNREEYQGSGLGLSICRKIIHNLGGKIWVESNAGHGSKFTFSLPTQDIGKPETTESNTLNFEANVA